jgi:prepilin-type N-terminal cleavage/methylation domain-containing protein
MSTQMMSLQAVTSRFRRWPLPCCFRVMRSSRGFTLIELLIVLSMIGIISAIGLPVLIDSSTRNGVWTASEQIASQVRQARLKAITRNSRFRVVFNCPDNNQYRVLFVDGTINNADRCQQNLPQDSGVYTMPTSVAFGAPPALEVNGRGQYSLPAGGVMPLTINVQYRNTHLRSFTVSITGQITFAAF